MNSHWNVSGKNSAGQGDLSAPDTNVIVKRILDAARCRYCTRDLSLVEDSSLLLGTPAIRFA